MNKIGFTIVCNKCGNKVDVKDDTHNKDYKSNKFHFYPIQSQRINIGCSNCGNEVYIDED
jgi:uncharacterized protein YlaI